MANYSIHMIARVIEGDLTGNPDIQISQLLTDSRSAAFSSASMFIAIKGKQHDGHFYIDELYNRGVKAFIVNELPPNKDLFKDAAFIVVPDSLKSLQQLAAWHRKSLHCDILAITGSNGKTIVKEWLYHCLSDRFIITRSPKSFNSQIGVPLSLWLLDETTELGIIEAGISLPGEMMRLREMIDPDTGIITNIGEAHQENFTHMEEKISEKLQLFYNSKTLIYCADHKLLSDTIKKTPELKQVRNFTWSLNGEADITIKKAGSDRHSTAFLASFQDRQVSFSIPFADAASVENAMHTLAVLFLYGVDTDTISRKMAELPPVAMRLEQKSALNNCTLINDSYNSDLTSLSIALDVLGRQLQHRKKTLILSDIYQTGKNQTVLYAMVSSLLKEKGVKRLIGIGKRISENASLFGSESRFFLTTDDFINSLEPDTFRDEAILLKGSRSFEFEKIAALLEQKKHTTRIEINLQALSHNLNYFRSLLKPHTKTMVMVKALSYGSGRHEIAGILQFHHVDYLGVAIADEGVSLRKAGIKIPIMVMNPEPESFDTIIQHHLEPEIYSFEMLDLFHKAVIRNQEINYPVHIKLDTGMHRLGFMKNETDRLCEDLTRYKNLRITSVFSHLAGSDESIFDEFTRQQINDYRNMSEKIIQSVQHPVIRHILNSSGIERFPEAQFDMVRLGIGLYGISSVDQSKMRTVSTLKSTILQIKNIEPGETVGYSRKGKPVKRTPIAIVPVGYADGLNRKLGNGTGSFLVKGCKAPVIGNICMDMTMIDITDIDAEQGDEVVIFGEGNPITDIANKLDTIPYEILTGVSERVKRVYFYE